GLGEARPAELPAAETLYAHRVLGLGDDEERLLAAAEGELRGLGIRPRRMLCGRSERLLTPDGPVAVRSLLVDGMGAEAGRLLQARGLGEGRCWGCGVFIPHKAVV
ncbi:type I-MYXAN CRISPR-associated protein Cas6/Cmx6, partial [Halorhodospira neutriphila]